MSTAGACLCIPLNLDGLPHNQRLPNLRFNFSNLHTSMLPNVYTVSVDAYAHLSLYPKHTRRRPNPHLSAFYADDIVKRRQNKGE